MENSREITTVLAQEMAMPAMTLAQALDRREQMVKFVNSILVDGTDFGVVPGTNKPTLLKPGAEKLCTFFGLTKRFIVLESEQDWIGEQHGGEPFFYYWYRCQLLRGDMLIAEGDGSCNSMEKKYRYRQSDRACPKCGNPTIIKGKDEYGGGWLCWAKKGGCGAKFKDGDVSIEGQNTGQVLNKDIADQVNTIQKMAAKRALVAATLLAVNASEFFTQDMEDIVEGEIVPVPAPPQKASSPIKLPIMPRPKSISVTTGLPAEVKNMNDFYGAAIANFGYEGKQVVVDALTRILGQTVLQSQKEGTTMEDLWSLLEGDRKAAQA